MSWRYGAEFKVAGTVNKGAFVVESVRQWVEPPSV